MREDPNWVIQWQVIHHAILYGRDHDWENAVGVGARPSVMIEELRLRAPSSWTIHIASVTQVRCNVYGVSLRSEG